MDRRSQNISVRDKKLEKTKILNFWSLKRRGKTTPTVLTQDAEFDHRPPNYANQILSFRNFVHKLNVFQNIPGLRLRNCSNNRCLRLRNGRKRFYALERVHDHDKSEIIAYHKILNVLIITHYNIINLPNLTKQLKSFKCN